MNAEKHGDLVSARAKRSWTFCASGITPRQIMTRKAFENAIRVVLAVGGSTNAVLHLLALAVEAGVKLDIFEFNSFYDSTPTLCDMKPAGRYVMDGPVQAWAGMQKVMRVLLDAGAPPRRLPDGHGPDRGGEPGRGAAPISTGRTSSTRCPSP